ncbi:hypothetical protein BGZ60DRAFT_423773 [Tricladium varicosporioides]|nr:hypothetical protein BGZ60DRAFT_423773 [Hymenoscyphus varicosporioides]
MQAPTLLTLPGEVQLRIFDKLDKATSACLGVTCKYFYPMYRELHGFVGLLCYTPIRIPNPAKKKKGLRELSKQPDFIMKKRYLHELLRTWINRRDLEFYGQNLNKFISRKTWERLENEKQRLHTQRGGGYWSPARKPWRGLILNRNR